ncbi:MAG TPA: right-handed parallel beta-helix repeat-containing protein [Rhodanobacteraceae bacterium]|nr:right-handed parallel beta-helix repeat-containing protein [Rhodanobacteraceae bacterium]
MNRSVPCRAVRLRPKPLAFALALAGFAAFNAIAHAEPPTPRATTSWTVGNCDDAGAGSLRDAVGHAQDGDTVDMTALACGTITLATGAIVTFANNLTVEGPGTTDLFIDGNYTSRALAHAGNGVLTVKNLSIWHGYERATGSDSAAGGGIASLGTVSLENVSVKYCQVAAAGTGRALGGAVYAMDFAASRSMIKYDDARTSDGYAIGGGVFARRTATFDYSTLSGNQAFANTTFRSAAGGAVAYYGGVLRQSTVSGNEAGGAGGVAFIGGHSVIAQSTVSGNSSTESTIGAGAHVASLFPVVVENSTITGNVERNHVNTRYGAGIHLGTNTNATIVSSIVSGNRLDDGTALLWFSDVGGDTGSSVGGDHDLMTLSLLAAPADTIWTLDPGLYPLADNGGPTLTHALHPTSAAIEAGSNPTGVPFDQRGSGYARVIGAHPDIGAVEFDLDDLIFANGFD